MRTWLLHRWHALRASYWFIPSLFAAVAVGLALGLLAFDRWLALRGVDTGWFYSGGMDGARALLTTLAGAMLSTAGVVFSITIVALSLASSQFGPRLLRNFLRDTGNQVTLGTFVATFLYCLIVLRGLTDGGDGAGPGEAGRGLPVVAISGAVALATGSLGVLIYFFDHVAASIQASHVVAAVARDLGAAVERFAARAAQGEEDDEEARPPSLEGAVVVEAPRSGYVQAIDRAALVAVARDQDAVVEAVHRAGDFVIEGGTLARMGPADRLDDESAERIRRAFLLGAQRTEEQDLEYAVRQLVEVALRALSPGINDPHTAMNCIDWLGDGIARIARHGMPPRLLRDAEGRVRLVTDAPSFAGVVDAAFNAIRQAAAGNVAVSICLLDTLGSLAPHLRRPFEREAVRVHADRVLDTAGPATPVPSDRAALAERHARARAALAAAGAPS